MKMTKEQYLKCKKVFKWYKDKKKNQIKELKFLQQKKTSKNKMKTCLIN